MDWPGVTAVICTRGDRPEYLRETIAAIVAQDYPGEVATLVVFDGAAPDRDLVSDAPGRPVRVTGNTRTPGLPGARNTGVLAATTELVAFCDDDDVWYPGKLRAQVRTLAAQPEAIMASCGADSVYDDEVRQCMWHTDRIRFADLLRSRVPAAHPSSFLLRRSRLLDEVGLVSEEIPGGYGEDYELLLRIARRAPIAYARELGVRVRVQGRVSHFHGRWRTIAEAHQWLLERYPEFGTTRRGFARLAGQVAFSRAALGEHRAALGWAWRALVRYPLEPRSYIVLAMTARLISLEWVLRRFAAARIST